MIAGVDEVGRGCLAGPVIAASVILKRPIKGLMDSKKLSLKKREHLSQVIIENSIFAIGAADNKEIDPINMLLIDKDLSESTLIDLVNGFILCLILNE